MPVPVPGIMGHSYKSLFPLSLSFFPHTEYNVYDLEFKGQC